TLGPTFGAIVGHIVGPVVGPVLGPIVGPVVGPVLGPVVGPVFGPVFGPGFGFLRRADVALIDVLVAELDLERLGLGLRVGQAGAVGVLLQIQVHAEVAERF